MVDLYIHAFHQASAQFLRNHEACPTGGRNLEITWFGKALPVHQQDHSRAVGLGNLESPVTPSMIVDALGGDLCGIKTSCSPSQPSAAP